MKQNKLKYAENQSIEISNHSESHLDYLVREGARQMLMMALEREVEDYIDRHENLLDESGKRLIVRNGYHSRRKILSGAGQIEIHQPRVNDRRAGCKFSSSILPAYMRKCPSIESLIPCLYLKGLSTNQFQSALEAILGQNCPGLSSSAISDMMKGWQDEFISWNDRDLSEKEYVYFWADGVHVKVRLGDQEKASLLVIIGATKEGNKELVGIYSGYRESSESWSELLRSFKDRGLKTGPKLAVGDGALGFWNAISEVYPETKQQRCWVHKTANILDKMPKSIQEPAKKAIHNIYLSDTETHAVEAYQAFIEKYKDKYPKATECLQKSRNELLAFYSFPAKHWRHIRSTNAIESTFATLRHRTRQTKGAGSRKAAEAMAWKLCMQAQNHWKKLNGSKCIIKIFEGIIFKDGEELKDQNRQVS